MEREGSGGEPGRGGGWGPARARSPALPGGSLCLETRRPEPEICREAQQLHGPRATELRLFMADPPSGGALGRRGPARGGRGEGPRRGRGRRASPPDPTAAPESQARSASLPPGTPPAETGARPGLKEVVVSAHGAPRAPAPAGGLRDRGAGLRGGEERRREEGMPRPPLWLARQAMQRDPPAKCPARKDGPRRARAGPAPSPTPLHRWESRMRGGQSRRITTPPPPDASGKGAGKARK